MSFNSCDEVIKSGLYLAIKDDGDSETVVFVAEPEARESTYKGQTKAQACFPVVTKDGLKVWPCPAKIYRQLKDAWSQFRGKAVKVVRHGAAGSQATLYELKQVKMNAGLRALVKKANKKDISSALEVAVNSTGGGDNDAPPF